MKRRTLDFIFAGGGVVLAGLLLILGLVLQDQHNFAKDYVKGELGAQKITFAAEPTAEETSWKPGSKCLTENAGKLMETGKQAECYANYYIALHMRNAAKDAYPPGTYSDDTYATMGAKRGALQKSYDAALKDNGADAATTIEAKKQLDSATALRGTFQTGETLRGLLLTTYGFSIFGDKGGLAAMICFIVAGLIMALAAAGFVHALMTRPDEMVLGGGKQELKPLPAR